MDRDGYTRLVRHGMVNWCVPTQGGTTTGQAGDGTLTLRGEIHDDCLRATYQLWSLWNEARGERPINDEAFCGYWAGLLLAGCGYANVVFDGDKPVAVSDCVLFQDPLTGKWTFHGDHAYCLPEYRRQGGLKMLHWAALNGRDYFNCDRGIAPTEYTAEAKYLRDYYLASEDGWEETTLILTWERDRS